MAGITGQGTTFNLPNFVGELFAVSREDTPFLSAIGGLTGGRPADATLFQWSTYDLRAPADDRQRLEGANAPTAEERVRGNVFNVVEIHQETIEVSYSKLAATGQFNSTGSAHPGSVGIAGTNAVGDEMAWQITQALKQIARDVNQGFLTGTFANPATNATARATRGILEAITTNVLDGLGTADIADPAGDLMGDLMQDVWDNGGIRESETRTLMCNSTQKRKLTQRYITEANYRETSRNVGGVNVTVLETDFGSLNIMLEPGMPQDEIAVVSLGECAPRFLPHPGKGFLFVEPLAKTGAAERSQIYGEVGLEYGVEQHHGKYIGLAV
ncbi:SU10 major capsid protein [Glycomyces tarimensis]